MSSSRRSAAFSRFSIRPALFQPRRGPADLGFVHIDPRVNLAHRHRVGLRQMRQHPPFGNAQAELGLVALGKLARDAAGGHGKLVGQESGKIEIVHGTVTPGLSNC
jgi:hypothetical protein